MSATDGAYEAWQAERLRLLAEVREAEAAADASMKRLYEFLTATPPQSAPREDQ